MNYFPLTPSDKEEMKNTIGIQDVKELFNDIPANRRYYSLDEVPSALPEDKLVKTFKALGAKNSYKDYTSFMGGGAYSHFVPEVVNYTSGKSEFLTPYTPYQAEVSQGSLQAMFEYQTMMCQLTGMEAANSSLYDGGTASVEGVLLALRKSRKDKVLIAASLHPEYIEIINSYIQNLGIEAEMVNYVEETGCLDTEDLKAKMNKEAGCVIFQSPNFFGVIEDAKTISEITHTEKAYSVQVVSEAMSLGLLTPPGEMDVDIVVGEAQSFGLPLSYGGPFLGFMSASKEFVRQMPGRIVGETKDSDGKRGYVLTLSTREQHIKREKATSNICSNQAWCAVRASIWLATMGRKGLRDLATQNHQAAAYFVNKVKSLDNVSVKYEKNFFNEIVLELKDLKADDFLLKLRESDILGGIPLHWFYKGMDNAVLVNFTELHDKEDIDKLIAAIGGMK